MEANDLNLEKEVITTELYLDETDIAHFVNSLLSDKRECVLYDKTLHCQMYTRYGNPTKEMEIEHLNIELKFNQPKNYITNKLRGRQFLTKVERDKYYENIHQEKKNDTKEPIEKIIEEYKKSGFKY